MLGSTRIHLHLHRVGTVAVVLVSLIALCAGCTAKSAEPLVDPQLSPPAIVKAGKLLVGVNMGSAPYATGVDGGGYTGIDVELSEAIAKSLGLEVSFVAVSPDEISEALVSGKADIVMSAAVGSAETTVVGEYLTGGPALYAAQSSGTEVNGTSVGTEVVAVQSDSPAFWWFTQNRGEDSVKVFALAAEALRAAELGEVAYAAVDSTVGQYAISAGTKVSRVGWVSGSSARGIAVSADNAELSAAVNAQYETLDSAGWIEALVRRWLDPAPSVSGSTETSSAPAQ